MSASATRRIHVIVLATGRGSRLGPLGEETPKWLLEIGGRTIADRHLEGVRLAGDHVASTRVVTGHGAETIERFVGARADAGVTGVETVFNPEYDRLNNWYSLLAGLRSLPEDAAAIAVLNADLHLAPGWVAGFLEAAAASPAEALLAVDLERPLTDESMKVSLRPDCTLESIGKVGIDAPAGEYIGMLSARDEILAALRAALEAWVDDPAAVNEWYEGAVLRTAAAGAGWHVWPTPGTGWVEIDDDKDLDAAVGLAT